jgi:hypothetical protein
MIPLLYRHPTGHVITNKYPAGLSVPVKSIKDVFCGHMA